MKYRVIALILFSVILSTLNGCATSHKNVLPPASVLSVTIPTTFQITGRMLVKYKGGNDYFRFIWRAEESIETIYINSAIGMPIAVIQIDPNSASLRRGSTIWQADNAEQLINNILKWPFPINKLRYWIFGVAIPDQVSSSWQVGSDWHLVQADWKLHFKQYVEIESNRVKYLLPKQIHISGLDIIINLALEEWMIGKPADVSSL